MTSDLALGFGYADSTFGFEGVGVAKPPPATRTRWRTDNPLGLAWPIISDLGLTPQFGWLVPVDTRSWPRLIEPLYFHCKTPPDKRVGRPL